MCWGYGNALPALAGARTAHIALQPRWMDCIVHRTVALPSFLARHNGLELFRQGRRGTIQEGLSHDGVRRTIVATDGRPHRVAREIKTGTRGRQGDSASWRNAELHRGHDLAVHVEHPEGSRDRHVRNIEHSLMLP